VTALPHERLARPFFARPTADVANDLVGKILFVTPASGALGPDKHPLAARITEVEAYLGLRDAASHARRGPTKRTQIMFGPPGFLYVYLIYGIHHCANIVTETDGVAGAVLLRAAEPLFPIEPGSAPLAGPGKLCARLNLTLADKGLDVTNTSARVNVADDGARPKVAQSRRIGVDYAGLWARRRLRFYVRGHAHTSGPRSLRV